MNMKVEFNLGSYEHITRHLDKELNEHNDVDIEEIVPKYGSKADSRLLSDVLVEYQSIIKFRVKGKSFAINLTMYNTDCSVQIQKYGGGEIKPSDPVPELENLTVAQYFGHEILIPLVKQINKNMSELNEHWKDQYKTMKRQAEDYESEMNKQILSLIHI